MAYQFIFYSFLITMTIVSAGCQQAQGTSDSDSQTSSDTRFGATTATESNSTASDSDANTDSATGDDTNSETDTVTDTGVDTGTDSEPYMPCASVSPTLCAQRSDCLTITAIPIDSENKCYRDEEPVECLEPADAPTCPWAESILAIDTNGQCWWLGCSYFSETLTFLPAKVFRYDSDPSDPSGISYVDTSLQVENCGLWIADWIDELPACP